MKKLLLVLSILVSIIARGQQLPNGDFENWVSQPYGEEPLDWGEYYSQIYNLIFPGLIDSTIVKSTDAYSGSYALEMRSKTYSSFGSVDTVAPFVMLNLKNANIDSAFLEIDSNLLSISGYIKQNLVNVDSNYTAITVMVFSNGNQEGVGSLIFDSSITNYTFFDVPIVYSGVPNGDSIEIYLFGCNPNYAIPGNIVKLDGLQLNYITNTPSVPKTYVPDDNFEAYLETHDAFFNVVAVGASNSMGDGIANNDSVTTANISGVTNLNVNSQNISDLTGIEDFTALNYLYCESNQLTSLDVTQNTALNILYCGNNQLTSLDVTQNTALNTLDCWNNQLTSLDVSQNTALNFLDCNNNQLTSLDVTQNTALTQLSCGFNQLTSLDVTQNTALNFLLSEVNQLTSLDVTQNTALDILDCGNNQLTSLDVTQNTALNFLSCGNNQLTSLDVRNGNNTNFTSFNANSNFNLNCISVDDTAYSNANWTNFDSHTSFSNDCALFSSLTADFSASDSTFCLGTSVTFTDLSTGTPTAWSWDFGDGNSSTIQNPTHTYASAGTYDVSLTVTTSSGSDSETKTGFITINSGTNLLDLGADTTLICDGSTQTLDAGTGFTSYLWNDGSTSQTLSANTAGTYIVTGTDANGCTSSDSMVIDVLNVDIALNDTTICEGNSIGLTLDGSLSNSNCIGNLGQPNPWPFPTAFDGGYISLGNFGAANQFSISFRINPDSNQNGISIILDCSHGGSSNWVVQNYPSGGNTYNFGNLSFTLIPNIWQNVLLTYDNGFKEVFINGVSTSTANELLSYSGSQELYLGNWPEGGRRFAGLIDELYITYDIQHNTNFLPLNYNSTPSLSSFGIWHFDEGIGSSTINSFSNTISSLNDWYWSTNSLSNSYLSNSTILWSTNENTSSITVQPSTATTYTVDVTSGNTTCQDSVTVTVNPIINTSINSTVCDSIQWSGNWLTTSGIYLDSLQNSTGCDSVVTLNLTISSGFYSEETLSACDSLLWSVNGNTYTQSGIYYDSLQSSNGCDSIYKLDLTISPSTTDFNYGGATTFCLGGTNPIATITGDSLGIFTATGGLVIDSLTGQIDLSTATAGNYNVTYTPPSNWQQIGADIDGEAAGDYFGQSSSMNSSGNRIVVGGYFNDGSGVDAGHVRVFENNGNNWIQLGQDIDGEASGDQFGFSTSMNSSGNIIAVGAYANDGNGGSSGHVRVFNYDGSSWVQIGQDIDGDFPSDQSGFSISISSNGFRIAIGSPLSDGNGIDAGLLKVFQWNGNSWSQLGNDIYGDFSQDHFGHSVSISNNGEVVSSGGYANNENGNGSGHVKVYDFNGGFWIQRGNDIYGDSNGDQMGHAVDLNYQGNRIAISSPFSDYNGLSSGHVEIYNWNGSNWSRLGQKILGDSGHVMGLYSAVSLNDSGNVVVMGSTMQQTGIPEFGTVNVYKLNGSQWLQYGSTVYGEGSNDHFGTSASINSSGSIFVAGSPSNDGNGNNSGHARIFGAPNLSCSKPLNITIAETTYGTDVISSCDSITWIDGITYTSNNNTASYTLTNSAGCDSIVTLNLTINQGSTGTDVLSSCDSITWIDGVTYTSNNNTASYTLTNSAGCDSIVTLNLTISSGFYSEETLSACDSLLWSINGNTYTQSGIYYDSLQSSSGCDSVHKLDLTVNISSSSLFSTSSCLSYNWNGQTLLASGIYIDTNINAAGCPQYDSLDLTITTNPIVSNEVACDSFAWNGNSYTTSGTYTNSSGTCVDTLNLTINNSSSSTSSLSSCDAVNWNGSTYSATGIYNFITTNSVGCDSTATLNLTIDSAVVSQVNVTACDSYSWNGSVYTASGTYLDTLNTSAGCDSIVSLSLTILQPAASNLNQVACDTYFWNGNSYNISGTYIDTLSTSAGCDSIVTLNLVINISYSSLESITSCSNYLWNGTTYSQSGTYYDSLQTVTSCDSVSILSLTINSSTNNSINISSCNTYSWNGNTYLSSGTFIDTLATLSGCDSIVTLNLIINNSFSTIDTAIACNSYSWNGNIYSQSGVYTDTLSSASGCDSIINLSLIISESYFFVDSVSSCSTYTFNGVQYTTSGVYTDTLTSSLGCDSIISLVLTINGGITSPITLELLLDDFCLETFWNVKDSRDTVIYNGQNYNCNAAGGGPQANTLIIENMNLAPNECYTFELGDVYGDGLGAAFWGGVDGTWIIKDFNNIIIGQGQGNFGFLIDYSFYVDQSVFTNVIGGEDLQPELTVYPNPFNESTTVKIQNIEGPHTLELFDLSGRIVKTITTISNEITIDDISTSRGIYWLVIKNQSNLKPIKLIKE